MCNLQYYNNFQIMNATNSQDRFINTESIIHQGNNQSLDIQSQKFPAHEINNLNRGLRIIKLSIKDLLLPSNHIKTIQSFLKLFPFILFNIFTRKSTIYFAILSAFDSVISEQVRIPLTPILLGVLIIIYLVKYYMSTKEYMKYDDQQNSRTALQYINGEWVETEWGKLNVGSIIKVKKDQIFPADVIPIYQNSDDNAKKIFISTYKIDKQIKISQKIIEETFIQKIRSQKDFEHKDIEITYENPNYNFEGTVTSLSLNSSYIDNDKGILGYQHFIMRGSQLVACQNYLVCVVVYTGNQCKIYRNLQTLRYQKNVSLLQMQIDKQIQTLIIIIMLLVGINLMLYIALNIFNVIQLTSNISLVNSTTIIQSFSELLYFSNAFNITIHIFLQTIRLIQFFKVKSKTNIKINNYCKSLDQFGQTSLIVTDESSLRESDKYQLSEIILPPNCECQQIKQELNLVSNSIEFKNNFYCEMIALDGYLKKNLLVHEQGFKIQHEVVSISKNKKKILIFCLIQQPSSNAKKDWIYYIISIGITQEIYSNLQSAEFTKIEEWTKKIKQEKSKGTRIVFISSKKLDKKQYNKFLQETISQSKAGYNLQIEKYQEKMKFLCVMLFKYNLQVQITNFVNEIKAVNIKFWVLTENSFAEIDDMLTATQIQNSQTQKFRVQDQNLVELTDHLTYIIGYLRKQQKRKQSVLFITSDALQHIQNEQIQLQLKQISNRCFALICFNSNNYQREKLFDTFRKRDKGILVFSKYIMEANMIHSANLSVSIQKSYSAKICDFQLKSIEDLRKLIFIYGTQTFKKNTDIVTCMIFQNTVLFGCQVLAIFGLTIVQSYIIWAQFDYYYLNLLFTSLPILYYGIDIANDEKVQYQTASKILSPRILWNTIALALFLSIFIVYINFAWMVQSMNVYDNQLGDYTITIFLGNIYIIMISQYHKMRLFLLFLCSLILYALELLVESYIVSAERYVTIQYWIIDKYHMISCFGTAGILTHLYLYAYFIYNYWNKIYLKFQPEREKQIRTNQASCRFKRQLKGRRII